MNLKENYEFEATEKVNELWKIIEPFFSQLRDFDSQKENHQFHTRWELISELREILDNEGYLTYAGCYRLAILFEKFVVKFEFYPEDQCNKCEFETYKKAKENGFDQFFAETFSLNLGDELVNIQENCGDTMEWENDSFSETVRNSFKSEEELEEYEDYGYDLIEEIEIFLGETYGYKRANEILNFLWDIGMEDVHEGNVTCGTGTLKFIDFSWEQ